MYFIRGHVPCALGLQFGKGHASNCLNLCVLCIDSRTYHSSRAYGDIATELPVRVPGL